MPLVVLIGRGLAIFSPTPLPSAPGVMRQTWPVRAFQFGSLA